MGRIRRLLKNAELTIFPTRPSSISYVIRQWVQPSDRLSARSFATIMNDDQFYIRLTVKYYEFGI